MRLYTDCRCAACNRPFLETDDVVVCPQCGAPHHRSCWQELCHCAHEEEHASGYEWVSDRPIPPKEEPAPAQQTAPRYAQESPIREEPPFPTFSATTQVIGPDDEFGGIKSRDWASYIRKSIPHYMLRFFQLEATHRKVSISIPAFLLGPIYFFYRKMYRWAAAYTAFSVITYLPTLMLFWYDTGSALTADINPNSWITIAGLLGYVNMAIKVLAGLFAVYLYKEQARRKIGQVYAQYTEDAQRTQVIGRIGGTNLVAPILYMVGFTVLISILMVAFAGPNLYSTLQAYMAQYGAL